MIYQNCCATDGAYTAPQNSSTGNQWSLTYSEILYLQEFCAVVSLDEVEQINVNIDACNSNTHLHSQFDRVSAGREFFSLIITL